ncbi:hypothetical protein L916_21731 [Phytophthora nicotianae]|uniref:Uncharacterized protein n=1 Tax=Phytophthora nicotianae TaxID=4792 RepID=W2HQY1_PHYNI|nr:hypothetical protein L916_21731 [Phytophthora nicotianae]
MSSGNSAFVDLTPSPRPAARDGPAIVSTIDQADPALDLNEVRASLNALQHAIDKTEALRELRSDHGFLRLRERVSITPASSKLAAFGIANCSSEAVSEFQDQISTLEAQLAAASSFGVIVPPDTARRIADMESQLARSQSDLQVARDRQSALASELCESATSHKTAQADVARLGAAVEHKTRHLRTLRDNYERRLRVADNTIATHSAELDRLQDRVSTVDRDLVQASQRVRAAISQRDQARAERIATPEGSCLSGSRYYRPAKKTDYPSREISEVASGS